MLVTSFHHIARLLTIVGLLWATASEPVSAEPRNAFAAERERMVADSIADEGVTNERVLESMRTVPRHQFVRADLHHPIAEKDRVFKAHLEQL